MLAQLVEQRTFNPLVGGSSPPRPTRMQGPERKLRPFMRALCDLPVWASRVSALQFGSGFLAQLVEQRTLNP